MNTRKEKKEMAQARGRRKRYIWIGVGVLVLVLVAVLEVKRILDGPAPEPVAVSAMNSADPLSGKPVAMGITSTFKEYTVGHCCATHRNSWEALSDAQKAEKVRKLLE